MGKNFHKGNRGHAARRRKDRDQSGDGEKRLTDSRGDNDWSEKLENERFESYYKAQAILSETEWPEFMESLRKPLPTTFRITGSRKVSADLRDSMVREHIPHLRVIEIDGEKVEPPSPIPWYPNNLGWQCQFSRNALRKLPEMAQFHQFLISETEVGNISRQEAVSMIPPLLLDVQPHHIVFDMCAAPGSKTAQIIEAVHRDEGFITGLVVANDADNNRSHMLVRQTKRLQSEALLVTNHEAQMMPTLYIQENGKTERLAFDRILCDVPCSGDGTLRKNKLIWRKWTVGNAHGLHPLQIQILLRGCQLLRVGGRLVYSTCSFNPIENEAVVAEVLRVTEGGLGCLLGKFVPVFDQGTHSISQPVGSQVVSNRGNPYETMESVPSAERAKLSPSMFSKNVTSEMNIDRCLRVYPHMQDTGGFFIAVMRKVSPYSGPSPQATVTSEMEVDSVPEIGAVEESAEPALKKRRTGNCSGDEEAPQNDALEVGDGAEGSDLQREDVQDSDGEKTGRRAQHRGGEDPVVLIPPSNKELAAIHQAFEISSQFPLDQYIVRTTNELFKSLYFVSATSKKVLAAAQNSRLKFVHAGVKVFIRGDNSRRNLYRLHSDGLRIIYPLLGEKRLLRIATRKDILVLLQGDYPKFTELSDKICEKLKAMEEGCAVAVYDPDSDELNSGQRALHHTLVVPLWRAKVSVNLLFSKAEKQSLIWQLTGSVQAEEEKRRRRIENGRDGTTGRKFDEEVTEDE
ncbi:tRNA (cytosine(34)-C(5))-methyltransferase [Gonapodya sp. JEL0774]|nr:tRNA (cytosine(34)-C(5))-methyltransferase [Gonapodya sp. JEL0774]